MSNYPEDQIAVKPLFCREWGDGVGEKPRVSLMENEEEQLKQCRGRFLQLNGHGYFDWCMLDANPRMGGHFCGVIMIMHVEQSRKPCFVG